MRLFRKSGYLGFAAFFSWMVFSGCLFDTSSTQPVIWVVPNPQSDLLLLDKVPADGEPDSAVGLYLPILDVGLGVGKADAPRVYPRSKVLDHVTGQVVEYVLTTQKFGNWNPDHEYDWNYFRLQTGFGFPLELPDTAGQGKSTSALYASLAATDRFTRYVDSAGAAAERQRILTTRAAALGLRLELNPTGDTLLIREAVADAPAWSAGARKGMRILGVQGHPVTGDSALPHFSLWSQGDSGVTIELTLLSASGDSLVISATKVPVDFPAVMVDTLQGVPVINLFAFAETTYGGLSSLLEFRQALLETQAYPVFILDLRQDPGGSLQQALAIADELLPGGVIIQQEQRFFDETHFVPLTGLSRHLARAGEKGEGRKLVILADSMTASASEILIAALRDGLDAPTVGTRTYGKGIGQMVVATPGGALSLITHLKFKAPKGEDYHGKGIFPAYPVAGTPAEALLKAIDIAREISGLPAAKMGAPGTNFLRRAQLLEVNRRERLRRGEHF